MREFLYGSAYYPEYMPYDRIDIDFSMMKEAGFNVIRIAESTWSTLEPTEGEYDFSYIDLCLKKAKEYGLYVIVGTPTYAIPSWLAKKYPDIMVETKNGREIYGKRQIFNLLSENFIEHAKNIIEVLVKHVVDDTSVIGFQIDNETKFYGNYGKEIQKAFIESLKQRYSKENGLSIEDFNKDFGLAYWSNSIHAWDDFFDMKGCIHGGLVSIFEEFQRSVAADYLKMQAEIVAEYKKENQFITHNFDFEWKKFGADIAQDGYSYGIQDGIHHLEASKYITKAGTDIYHPTKDRLTGAEISFCGDEIRSLKHDNYMVLECQAQAFKYWTPYPGQLRQHLYSHIASGADTVMYWNWHSIHNSFETYWKGVLSHNLSKNRIYDEISAIGNEIKALGKENLCIQKKAKIAVLVDTLTLSANKFFPMDKDLSYNDVVRRIYDSLYELNYEVDILFSESADVDAYEAIVIPALYCASDDLIKRLTAFVKRGGILISTFRSFIANRNITVYHDNQPHGLCDCFGIHYDEFVEPGDTLVDGKEVKYYAELLEVDTAKVLYRYEHKYWKEYAAITEHEYGKGRAYYIGAYVDKEVLKKVLDKALCSLREEKVIDTSIYRFPIIVKSGRNEKNQKIHYVFHYSKDENEIILEKDAMDILSEKRYKKGDKVLLKDWAVFCLREE